MTSRKIILALLTITLFERCDPGSTIKYKIENATGQPIKVKYQFVFNDSGDTSVQESIIKPDSSKIINTETPLGSVKYYDKKHDLLFIRMLTIQNGDQWTRSNFKDKKYWMLDKENEYSATYKLTVTPNLFDR